MQIHLKRTAGIAILIGFLVAPRPVYAFCPYKACVLTATLVIALMSAKPLGEVWRESSNRQRFGFVSAAAGMGYWGVRKLWATTPEKHCNMYDELVTRIEELLAKQPHVVVAISGFGGSGKSTLAEKLRDHFKIRDEQIIRIDNLYGPNPNGPGIFDQSNWPLITSILNDVRAGKRLQYQGKDSRGEILHFDEALPRVVIVEGIRLLQPALMPNFDLSVWIDCPQNVALQRAKARDRSQGDDEEEVARWDTDWGPKDKKYFDTYRPDQLATCLYGEYK